MLPTLRFRGTIIAVPMLSGNLAPTKRQGAQIGSGHDWPPSAGKATSGGGAGECIGLLVNGPSRVAAQAPQKRGFGIVNAW